MRTTKSHVLARLCEENAFELTPGFLEQLSHKSRLIRLGVNHIASCFAIDHCAVQALSLYSPSEVWLRDVNIDNRVSPRPSIASSPALFQDLILRIASGFGLTAPSSKDQ